ncbi:metal-sulfur cluster biosynthetic enzyme [Gordonia sp. CPCC 205515]|uniref:metal-sulfur cluster biosynthetic enzyme n=1 Tax=Gordonia sp. CPCC 205515 TaxID=3140791 RepID=UPI003AF3DA56
MTALVDVSHRPSLRSAVDDALSGALDPVLTEPTTDTGLLASVSVVGESVSVVLQLSESVASAAMAFVLAADVADALYQVADIGEVCVQVSDHPNAARINAGLSSTAFYLEESDDDTERVDEVRAAFDRRAHDAAVRRCLDALIRDGRIPIGQSDHVLLRDLPRDALRSTLMRRRANLGLSLCPNSRVLVDHTGAYLPDPGRRAPLAS